MSEVECGIVIKQYFQVKLEQTGLMESTGTYPVSNLCPVKIIALISLLISLENNVCYSTGSSNAENRAGCICSVV